MTTATHDAWVQFVLAVNELANVEAQPITGASSYDITDYVDRHAHRWLAVYRSIPAFRIDVPTEDRFLAIMREGIARIAQHATQEN